MPKLTKDDIQFIDTYLKNSDVIYDDIRIEMVDHVATAIENELADKKTDDFYTIFKNYMVENKKALIDSNNQFVKKAHNRVGKMLLNNMLTKTSVLVLVSTILLAYFSSINLEVKTFYRVFGFLPLIIIIASLYLFPLIKINKKPQKFSALHQFGMYAIVFQQVQNLIFNPILVKEDNYSIGYFLLSIVLTYLAFMFAITANQLRNYYKNKYQFIS